MKRFTNHPEPWGEFVDVKSRPAIDRPGRYAGEEAFFCSVTDPYQPPVICNDFDHEEVRKSAKKPKE